MLAAMVPRLATLCGTGALLLSATPAYGVACTEGTEACASEAFEDASLIALRPAPQIKQEPYKTTISSGMRGEEPSRGATGPSVYGAELSTNSAPKYGRFEAKIQWAGADGVISSFFLWKAGSEKSDTFWRELDYEKLGLDGSGHCKMGLNMIGGKPGPDGNGYNVGVPDDICTAFHVYTYEWTSDYVAWFVDGVQYRREEGWNVQNWNNNGNPGMEFHFNLWVGDWTFGGNFNAGSLPLYQYIDWARYSSWDPESNSFTQEWQEDFDLPQMPDGFWGGEWTSPLGHSEHRLENIVFKDGYAILALTGSEAPKPEDIPSPGPDASPTPGPEPSPTSGPGPAPVPSPGPAPAPPPDNADCSGAYQDCRSTKCCKDSTMTCYEKDQYWAMCRTSCESSGSDRWSCKVLR